MTKLKIMLASCLVGLVTCVSAEDKPFSDRAAASSNLVSRIAGSDAPQVPDAKQVGGEAESVVQVANLIYAGVKSSQ